jgi:transcriptional regulator with XRE-family HTH domain
MAAGKREKEVGERIRAIRGELSQAVFAEKLGIGRTSVIRYESGERQPDVEMLVKLNLLYGVQPLWLLTGKFEATAGVQLTPREAALLENYRRSPEEAKLALERTSAAFAQHVTPAVTSGQSVHFSGSVGSVSTTNHGEIDNSKQRIRVGRGSEKK